MKPFSTIECDDSILIITDDNCSDAYLQDHNGVTVLTINDKTYPLENSEKCYQLFYDDIVHTLTEDKKEDDKPSHDEDDILNPSFSGV